MIVFNNPYSQGLWDKKNQKISIKDKEIIDSLSNETIKVSNLQNIFVRSLKETQYLRYQKKELRKYLENLLKKELPDDLVFELKSLNTRNSKRAKMTGIKILNKETKESFEFNCLCEELNSNNLERDLKKIGIKSFYRKCRKIS